MHLFGLHCNPPDMFRLRILGQIYLCLLTAAAAAGQNATAQNPSTPASLADLEKAVQNRTAEWDRLAQNLELSLIRLLPCDPKIAASITAVNRASGARITAVAAYLEAANHQAELQANAARQVLASAQGLGTDLAAEKSGMAPERAAVDGLIVNLNQSLQRRPSLSAPADGLKQVLADQQQRADAVDSSASHAAAASMDLADLVMQLDARRSAWSGVQSAFQGEAVRWNAYYAARLARAQTECNITRGLTPPKPAPQGKQK